MEGSVLSPTSWEKRRAWIRQSRQWQTQVVEEAEAVLPDVLDSEPSTLDDVFQEGKQLDIVQIPTLFYARKIMVGDGRCILNEFE